MSEYDEPPIAKLRRHCAMYRFGLQASQNPLLGEAGTSFFAFAGLHLMCTMFITSDDGGRPPHGVFHKLLDPMGQSHLMDDVDRTLGLPVGETTLREYLRHKRNKLTVHGTLAWSSQPDEVQAVVFDDVALEQYWDAAAELNAAVDALDRDLATLEA